MGVSEELFIDCDVNGQWFCAQTALDISLRMRRVHGFNAVS